MSREIFYPRELHIENQKEKPFKLSKFDSAIVDKDEADFCLNCTKPKCNGECKEYREFMKEKKKNGKKRNC